MNEVAIDRRDRRTASEALRLSEHFVSPQGEGPRTGTLTQFVRFAGCNMRCPGWPCDTQYAIEPSIYLKDSYKCSPSELYRNTMEQTELTGAKTINLTGGEPFQQNHDLLGQFINALPDDFFVECFSNGSFLYPSWALSRISFVMDWKLGGSGEAETATPTRLANANSLQEKDAIKFVCVDQDDLEEARRIWTHMKDMPVQFWAGAAWGRMEPAAIVEFIKFHKLPWKLNVQVHNYVYAPQERGR